MQKLKLTKMEKRWIGYDVGNSAFILLATTILPIYFNILAENAGLPESTALAYWGYAASIVTLIVAAIGPVFGAIADGKGRKKKIFGLFVLIGIVCTVAMAVPMPWLSFLIFFILAKVGFSASLVIYDAMLTDISEEDRMDTVSSHGYAWGYIGSVIPFILGLLLVLKGDSFGLSSQLSMTLALLITAVWWGLFTWPLLKNYEQVHYNEEKKTSVGEVFRGLGRTLKDIKKNRKVYFFLLAFFFYIDGVYTIIDMAVAYGSSLGLDSSALLIALLVTQIVAFPAALFTSYLSRQVENSVLLKVFIVAYSLITAYAIQLDQEYEFWILAVAVGLFQGGIQAISRSYFAKIIPAEKSGEYFGIYDIFGKGASFLGTFSVSIISHITGKQNLGISVLLVMFILGYIYLHKASKEPVQR